MKMKLELHYDNFQVGATNLLEGGGVGIRKCVNRLVFGLYETNSADHLMVFKIGYSLQQLC
jgi:hypothetical protein